MGLVAAVIHYSILVFLVELLNIHVVLSTTLGFAVAGVVNYASNRRFTFASNTRHRVALPKFLTVALLGAAMNACIVAWFEMHTSMHYLIAQACATITVLGWNFTGHAVWTFGRRIQPPHRP
jgi:putative flippase GtrA